MPYDHKKRPVIIRHVLLYMRLNSLAAQVRSSAREAPCLRRGFGGALGPPKASTSESGGGGLLRGEGGRTEGGEGALPQKDSLTHMQEFAPLLRLLEPIPVFA